VPESDPDDLYQQGFRRFAARDYDGAIAMLAQALERNPRSADVLRTIAMAHFRKGEFEQAVAYGRQLAEVEPDDIMSHSSLSLFLMKAGRIQEAEDAQAKARTLEWKRQLKEGKDAKKGDA
jgi:Flp pilus assembly protein TadD